MLSKRRLVALVIVSLVAVVYFAELFCSSTSSPTGSKEVRMLGWLKKLVGRKKDFTAEEYERYNELKEHGLESVLGPMHNVVGHALIPFAVGGFVDMYYFCNALEGTAFVTMELIEPDGTGPVANSLGTYELIAATRKKYSITPAGDHKGNHTDFEKIGNDVCGFLTCIGHYSRETKIEPGETCELPEKDGEITYLLFDEYATNEKPFKIGDRRHGLLLCIQIFKSECDFARQNGGAALIAKLKEKGVYPYSDMDRKPVVTTP